MPAQTPITDEQPTRQTRLMVIPWPDPVLDALGHDPRSAYVETFWLPHLGPTAAWLLRSFANRFDVEPDGFEVAVQDAARDLGIGPGRGGANAPLLRTIDRISRFGVVQRLGNDRLSVRRRLPPLTQHQAGRLPRHLRRSHTRWHDEQRARQDHPGYGGHAARLARSLLDLGASNAEVFEQLERWRFRGEAAERAIRCAEDLEDQRRGEPARAEPPLDAA